MTARKIIDSHIHLWPEDMANEEGHTWLTPEMPLSKAHLLSHYLQASRQVGSSELNVEVEGVVYVETDVRYNTPSGDIKTWAKGPLDEIKFLRAMVEDEDRERDGRKLVGIVLWAPLDQPTSVLEEWLAIAEETAGIETWKRVKGFRFLLQSILDEHQFKTLVSSNDFINRLQLLGRKGFVFDVGVDQHSGGIWQLEAISVAMTRAHQDIREEDKIGFVLNHLCKPDFVPDGPDFDRWCKAIQDMSGLSKTYMKLSGAFSELPDGLNDVSAIVTHVRPWVEQVFTCFGPNRVMFGSDWPICNVKGPLGEGSWVAWKEVVETLVEHNNLRLNEDHKESIWRGTAVSAYNLI